MTAAASSRRHFKKYRAMPLNRDFAKWRWQQTELSGNDRHSQITEGNPQPATRYAQNLTPAMHTQNVALRIHSALIRQKQRVTWKRSSGASFRSG